MSRHGGGSAAGRRWRGRISSRLLLITSQALFSALQQTYTSPFVVVFFFLVHAGLFDYFADNLPLSDRLGNRSFGSMSCMSVWVLGLYGFARNGILMPVLNVTFNGVIN